MKLFNNDEFLNVKILREDLDLLHLTISRITDLFNSNEYLIVNSEYAECNDAKEALKALSSKHGKNNLSMKTNHQRMMFVMSRIKYTMKTPSYKNHNTKKFDLYTSSEQIVSVRLIVQDFAEFSTRFLESTDHLTLSKRPTWLFIQNICKYITKDDLYKDAINVLDKMQSAFEGMHYANPFYYKENE